MTPLLQLSGITKVFPGVRALENVQLALWPGKVTALIGENGAGKSTLVKVMTGIYQPDEGEILYKAIPVHLPTPESAHKMGITAIHQETVLFDELSVTENIFVGQYLHKGFLKKLDWSEMHRRAQAILMRLEVQIDPRATLKTLSIAQRHMVAIARALSFEAQVVILDEPTAALSQHEILEFYQIVERLKQEGKAILFISHKFDEIFELADHYTILRDGVFVGAGAINEITEERMVSMMVGRAITQTFPKIDCEKGETVLEVKNLCHPTEFAHISFSLRKGEILGFYGLVGAGRTEFAETLYGLRPVRGGRVWLENQEITTDPVSSRLQKGLVYLPEDRQVSGLFLDAPIRWNTVALNEPSLWQQRKRESAVVERYHRALGIKLNHADQTVRTLSGGNQQKVLLARCLEANPLLLIVDEPTRGVDVSARADIYQLLKSVAAQNVAVLMISSDLDEFPGLADRVLVMHQGVLSGELPRHAVSLDRMMALAFGGQS